MNHPVTPSVDVLKSKLRASVDAQVIDSLITNLAATQAERDIWRDRAMKAEADCVASKEKLAPKPEILTSP